MKTLAPTFSTVSPVTLGELQRQSTKLILTSSQSLSTKPLSGSSGFPLDSISASDPLDYACFLVFSRLPHTGNPTLEWLLSLYLQGPVSTHSADLHHSCTLLPW